MTTKNSPPPPPPIPHPMPPSEIKKMQKEEVMGKINFICEQKRMFDNGYWETSTDLMKFYELSISVYNDFLNMIDDQNLDEYLKINLN